MITIRKAEEKDLPQILNIIQEAKTYFALHHIPQWQNGYPEEMDIQEDIDRQGGYVAQEDGMVLGYSFIQVMQDHNYDVIEGKWRNEESYAVMHRTCIHDSAKGRGIAGLFVKKAESLSENVRADTHELNTSMRKMLEKNGFTACGIIYVEDGTPRVAYQKIKERN
jgi:ribosomal protein S18 acetylase RimI-like enzyme